jgi:hypothetical protein
MRTIALALLLAGCLPAPVPTTATCADACNNGRRLARLSRPHRRMWATGLPVTLRAVQVQLKTAGGAGCSA